MQIIRGTTPDILRFILYTYCPLKKLMRLIGYSTGNTNVVIADLIKKGLIEEKTVQKNTILNITKSGIEYLSRYYRVDKDLVRQIRARASGDNKMRQVKLAATLQMLNPSVPNYIPQYLSFFERLRSDYKISNAETAEQRSTKIENIRKEISFREAHSLNGNYFLSTREMRELDSTRMRNMSTTRAQGLLSLGGQEYVVYNTFKARMRAYGDAEWVYRDFIEDLLNKKPQKALFFGVSNRIAMETINERHGYGRDYEYIINNRCYSEQYFVPMNYFGAKQMLVYGNPEFDERATKWLVYPENQMRAQNTTYDGITEDGDIVVLGFKCDLNKIMQIRQNIKSIRAGSEVYVFCFPHQAELYSQAFGDDGHIYVVDYDEVFRNTGIQAKRIGE